MNDRIDNMEPLELREMTRHLVREAKAIADSPSRETSGLRLALRPFQPNVIDKVRELLRSEGYVNSAVTHQMDWIEIDFIQDQVSKPEFWVKP